MNKARQLVLRDPVTNSIRAYLSTESSKAAVFLRMAKLNKPFLLPLRKSTDLSNLKGLGELSQRCPILYGNVMGEKPEDPGEKSLCHLLPLRDPKAAASPLAAWSFYF